MEERRVRARRKRACDGRRGGGRAQRRARVAGEEVGGVGKEMQLGAVCSLLGKYVCSLAEVSLPALAICEHSGGRSLRRWDRGLGWAEAGLRPIARAQPEPICSCTDSLLRPPPDTFPLRVHLPG